MGFLVVNDIGSSGYAGTIRPFSVASTHTTALAIGDVVAATGTGDTTEALPGVDAATAGATFQGIIVGTRLNLSSGESLNTTGIPATTAGTVLVQENPDILYQAPVTNGSLTVANIGQNIDIAATAATSTGGMLISNMSVDAATATASSAQFRIEGFAIGTNGAPDFTRALVRPNESARQVAAGV